MEPKPTPMLPKKPFWLSKTVIGVIFMVIGWVLKQKGIHIELAPIRDFVDLTLEEGVFYLGAFLSLLGRYTANTKVVLWPKKESS